MTDKEYLLRLDLSLSGLPFEERTEVLESVQYLFDQALQKGHSYASVMKNLGSPEMYGKEIIESFDSNLAIAPSSPFLSQKKSSSKPLMKSWWKIGLFLFGLIFLFPLFLGLILIAIGLFLSLVMVFLSLIVAFISGIFATIIVFGKGLYLMWFDPLGAVFDFGATLFGIGLTWLLGLFIQRIIKVAWPKWCQWLKKMEKSLNRWIKEKGRFLT